MNDIDTKFIKHAIQLALTKMTEGCGGPFGAVVVKDGKIISEGYNCVTSNNDPTAHAEVQAIRKACEVLNTFQLTDCTLYTSCEPCPMCLGALYWARPQRIVFASSRQDAAAAGFDDEKIYQEISLPYNKRTICTEQLTVPEKNIPFEAWLQKQDKTEY